MKLKKANIYLIATIAITIFIFSNSMQTAPESSAQSGRIVRLVCNLFNITSPDSVGLMVFIIRKLAHMAEFCAQSFLFSMFFFSKKKEFFTFFIYVLFAGLFTACIDEYLQLFSPGRSGEIRDVFIDFSGTCIGLLVSLLLTKILKRNKERTSL